LVDNDVVRSRNALIITALEYFMDYVERQAIDAQFAAMADDKEYHALSLTLAEEFTSSDWEAFELGEAQQ